jgi:hypothetical protein
MSGVGMNSHLRVRWDRVFVLFAALIVVLVLIGHAIFRGADAGHADSTSAEPHQAAAAPSPKPCPPPTPGMLRAAPGEGEQRTVALTFDDGPGPWTDEVLEILARENVKATFFVIGNLAVADRDRVKRAYAAGHAVENHSWSHPWPQPTIRLEPALGADSDSTYHRSHLQRHRSTALLLPTAARSRQGRREGDPGRGPLDRPVVCGHSRLGHQRPIRGSAHPQQGTTRPGAESSRGLDARRRW